MPARSHRLPPRPTSASVALLTLTGLLGAVTAAPVAASPGPPIERAATVPGEIVIGELPQHATAGAARARASVRGEVPFRTVKVKDVDKAIRAVKRRASVVYAVPNVKARVTAFVPNDPGRGKTPGGWQSVQWNFTGPWSVNAPEAWQNLRAAGRQGGRGVTVAVLDTGVAYRARGDFLQSPDLRPSQFVRGYDFVDRDPYPSDRNGHGTHVASTIAERTNNGVGLTGLAYGARIMPVRVLDDEGEGDASDIADGIRFAARKGVDIINLSLEFGGDVTAAQVPQILDALRFAARRGVLTVGAAGNEGARTIALPARSSRVLAVGATTERGCLSEFSNIGRRLDIVAPGGGADAALADDPNCRPEIKAGRDIFQVTLHGRERRSFGIPSSYQGTSMAAPHVSATAALVFASGVLGPEPTADQVHAHLRATARDLGTPGPDERYGAGLLDAAAATRPVTTVPAAPAVPPAR